MRTASVKLMEGGKRTSKGKEPKDIRSDVLRQLEQLELN